ncbi:MAG: hypothetical protein HXY34_05275 [Candidatus Thorarchaeota archaeon]|nr:hypothetical protein [Candidatus Thorarchaeota archaeon]
MDEERKATDPEPEKVRDAILAAVESDQQEESDDGLTQRERDIERAKQEERIRKAQELKKQLRKKQLGLLRYRWPAIVLVLNGVISAWTEFLPVMVHSASVGFDTFIQVCLEKQPGNVFFILPVVAGVMMVVLGCMAYRDPRATFLSLIPGALMAMSGGTVYFLISFAQAAVPEETVYATGTPLVMIVAAALTLLAVVMRERE